MRFLGVIVAGALVTPERSIDDAPSSDECNPEVVERLEAHVAFLGREVAIMREEIGSLETTTLRHDAALAGLSRLGRSAHIDGNGDLCALLCFLHRILTRTYGFDLPNALTIFQQALSDVDSSSQHSNSDYCRF